MVRKIFVVLLGCWALGVSAALIRAHLEAAEFRARQEQFEMLLFKQSEIIAVNTVIMKALVQRMPYLCGPEKAKPLPELHLDFRGSQLD